MLNPPDYEVKMLVQPGLTLDADGQLTGEVRDEFQIKRSTQAVMLFMDGGDRALDLARWIVRIRAFDDDDEPNLQLTYKKRNDIADGSDEAIDGAHAMAASEGFPDAPNEEYDSQVEWGRDRLTLTVSLKAEARPRDPSLADFPGLEEARQIALSAVPSVMEQQVPDARAILEGAHLYGPVFGVRYTGEWEDDTLSIEVWTVRAANGDGVEQIVEVSFKKKPDRRERARRRHGDLRDLLETRGWMADEQRSKTEIILERYGP